jgi:hypothetical protein
MFRFNSGRGGVTCDMCNVLYDADLGYKEYESIYGTNETDLCWKCKENLDVAIKLAAPARGNANKDDAEKPA